MVKVILLQIRIRKLGALYINGAKKFVEDLNYKRKYSWDLT